MSVNTNRMPAKVDDGASARVLIGPTGMFGACVGAAAADARGVAGIRRPSRRPQNAPTASARRPARGGCGRMFPQGMSAPFSRQAQYLIRYCDMLQSVGNHNGE